MCMKLAGFLLLLAGWAIVVAAVVLLLPANARTIFVLAGVGVEIIGLTLAIRSNPLAGREKEEPRAHTHLHNRNCPDHRSDPSGSLSHRRTRADQYRTRPYAQRRPARG